MRIHERMNSCSRMMLRVLVLWVVYLPFGWSQTIPPLKRLEKKADAYALMNQWYQATDTYAQIIDYHPEAHHVRAKWAHSLFQERNYRGAAEQFALAASAIPQDVSLVYYHALSLKMMGIYDSARFSFTQVLQHPAAGRQSQWRKWAQSELLGCEKALKMLDDPFPMYSVISAGKSVNSPGSDIAPVYLNDSTLLFATFPRDSLIILRNDTFRDESMKFYRLTLQDSVLQMNGLHQDFNQKGLFVGNGSLNAQKNRFYFTICSEGLQGDIRCDLYVSHKKYGLWYYGEKLPGTINDLRYTQTHPSVAALDDEREVIYFSTNRPGGQGGMDLWFTIRDAYGKFQAPVNLGKTINTARDELTPFYDVRSRELYFSSNGHPGVGGLDIFVASGKLALFQSPVLLPMPVNSHFDDFYYTLHPNKGPAIMVSNRAETEGGRSSNCCDDLYLVWPMTHPSVAIWNVELEGNYTEGTVLEVYHWGEEFRPAFKDLAGTLIPMASIPEGARLWKEIPLDSARKTLSLPQWGWYGIRLRGSGMIPMLETFEIPKGQTKGGLKLNPIRWDAGMALWLDEVLFGFNDSKLSEEARLQLDALWLWMMEDPTLMIRLEAHTDQRGLAAYNQTLSERRAEACRNYLIGKGLPPDRLEALGLGMQSPLKDCFLDPLCQEDPKADCECHKNNRRTTVVLMPPSER